MTETVSRGAFNSLSKIQRAVLLLLEEEGKVQIIDDTEEAPPHQGATRTRRGRQEV